MIDLGRYKLVAFDLDGTLHVGDEVVDGALELVSRLQHRCKVAFLTNNSTRTRAAVAVRLRGLGFAVQAEDVYTSAYAAAIYLQKYGGGHLFVIGSDGLQEEIAAVGVTPAESADDAEGVLVGLDFSINYDKLKIALQVLQRGGIFVACNKDPSFPLDRGVLSPGCGAMVGAIAGCTGRQPDVIVGKPSHLLLQRLADEHGLESANIVVVGDSLENDILMAEAFGCDAVFVGSASPDERYRAFSISELLQTI